MWQFIFFVALLGAMPKEDTEAKMIFETFFSKHSTGDDVWACKICGMTRKQKSKGGYTNTSGHVYRDHPEWKTIKDSMQGKETEEEGQKRITSWFPITASEEAKSCFQWLNFVVTTDQAFSCVENEAFRAFSKSKGMSRKFFMKLLHGVRSLVGLWCNILQLLQ